MGHPNYLQDDIVRTNLLRSHGVGLADDRDDVDLVVELLHELDV